MATVFGLFSSPNAGDSLSLDIVTVTSNDDPDGYSIGLDRKILLNQPVASLEEEEEAPRIAYLITGTKGDSQRMRRTLQAIYHPRNQYILHLDLEAPPRERIDLTMYVKGDLLFSEVENVRMIVKANLVTYKGPTMIACSLHAISILLKEKLRWGWENLPRTVLMYYVNFFSSPEGCFHTVICNSDAFRNTSISHDLHYINWDNPPKQHPLYLTSKDFDRMVKSGMPFAWKFAKRDLVLDKIDRELLGRSNGQVTPGGWCTQRSNGAEQCSSRADDFKFMPGPGAERLQQLMKKLMSDEFRNGSCSKLQYGQTKRDWIVFRKVKAL